MKMKLKWGVLVLLGLLLCVSNASAGWTDWVPAGGSQDWFTAGNWTGGVPDAGSPTVITSGGSEACIISNGAATVRYLFVGDSSVYFTAHSTLGELKIASTGSLQVEGVSHSYIGGDTTLTPPDAEGILTVDGGSVNVLLRNVYIGNPDNSKGTLKIINGGTFTTAGMIGLGRAEGYLKLYSGTLQVDLDVNGFYLDPNADVDIRGTGLLKWKGNHVAYLNGHITAGKIYAGEAGESLAAPIYDSDTNYTTLTMVPVPVPMTLSLLVIGMGSLFLTRRRNIS